MERRCECEEDFIQMVMENSTSYNPLKYKSLQNMAQKLWAKLIEKESSFYKKYEYIDVIYDINTRTYFRKKSVGRPKVIQRKEHRITIRLSDDQLSALDNYCQTNNVDDRSGLFREALMDYIKS